MSEKREYATRAEYDADPRNSRPSVVEVIAIIFLGIMFGLILMGVAL